MTTPSKDLKNVCQQFVLELLTETNSMTLQPNRGCRFLYDIRHAKNECDFINAFFAAMMVVRNTLQTDMQGAPATLQLKSAQLVRILLEPGLVGLAIVIQNQAGEIAHIKSPQISL